VEIEGVDVLVHRLIGTTKTEAIRSDDAVPRSDKRRDHLSIQVIPTASKFDSHLGFPNQRISESMLLLKQEQYRWGRRLQ
jgi:hypothetical protein